MTSRRTRTTALSALALLVAALTGLGLWHAARPQPATPQQQVRAVAGTLRCPACEGQSVAESSSDMAAQMRTVVSDQLAAGRSPAQVRQWFAQRYGDSVLLDPPWRGPGLWLQVLPVVVLAAGLLWLVAVRRPAWRRRLAAGGVGLLAVAVALMGAVALHRGDATQPVATAATGGMPRAADPVQRAAALLAQGRPADAERVVRPSLRTSSDPRLLLVHGLAQRQLGDTAWSTTLREFLRQAPDDPAAARVKGLLAAAGH